MTIQAAVSEKAYAGDGVSTVFAIPFPFDTSADLKLTSTDSAGNITTLSTGFTISGGGGSTGNATFSVAPATGVTITIYDDPAQTQPTNYVSLDAFPAESHEKALDRVTRIAKRLSQQISRAIRAPDGEKNTPVMSLPAAASRANLMLTFDGNGNVLLAPQPIAGSITQTLIGQLLYPRTAAEIAAGATPANYAYPPLTVDRYGSNAIPGTTDMTAAVNAAIAAANATGVGGVVQFLGTKYLVGSAGVFVSFVFGNVLLQGVSREATIIVNGSTNQPAVLCGNGTLQIYGGGIRNMSFTQKAGVTAVNGNTGFTYSFVGNFLIENVLVSNAIGAPYRGAVFTSSSAIGCSQFDVVNLQIQGCLNDGETHLGSLDVYASRGRSDSNGGAGRVLNATQGGYFNACTTYSNNSVGWYLHSGSPVSAPNKNNFFVNCVGDTSGSHNWQIDDCQDSSWIGCWGSTQQSITVNTAATGFYMQTQYCARLRFVGCIAITNNGQGFQIVDTGASAPTAITLDACFGMTNGRAAGGGYGLAFNGVTNQLRVNGGQYTGNTTANILNQSSGNDIVVTGNPVGYVTNNEGLGTIAAAATSVVINHGLGFTPNATQIQVWPTSLMSASGVNSIAASTFTATQFTVTVNAAVAGSSLNFGWRGFAHGT